MSHDDRRADADFRKLIPQADDQPVFREPWEARAFALTVQLHQTGCFGWTDWAAALSEAIKTDPQRDYFLSWLAALESLTAHQGVTSDALSAREQAWHDAAARTPHGEPIEL